MKRTMSVSLVVLVLILVGSAIAGWTTEGNITYTVDNVGIGVREPEQKLHVSGSAIFELGRGRFLLGTPGGWPGLIASSPNGHRRDICFRDEGIIIAASRSERTPPNENGIWIAENGNVGIGTLGPRGRLDVNGPIFQRGRNLHADYVFEPGYELESIDEHSHFMWRNRHLKAIPKASVVGDCQEIVDIGSHLKGTVEELEKAHIYIEQLHKRIRALEEKDAEIVALQQQNETMRARLVVLESLVAKLTSFQAADQR